jgi:hypothetical protein
MKPEIDNYLQSIDMPAPRTEKNNLSYCTICSKVYESYWAFQYGRQETKHHDMPTYGLDRKDCQDCAKREG